MTTITDPTAVLPRVRRIRRTLANVLQARLILLSAGTGLAVWIVTVLLLRAAGVTATPEAASDSRAAMLLPIVVAAIAAVVTAVMVHRAQGSVSMMRAALWIEEHGGSGYALVTWVEQHGGTVTGDVPSSSPSSLPSSLPSPSLGRVVARASSSALAAAQDALSPLARAQLVGPAAFALGATFLTFRAVASPTTAAGSTQPSATSGAAGSTARDVPIGAWRVRVTPPAYTGLPAQTLGDTNAVRVLSGTRIEILGSDATPDSVMIRSLAPAVSTGASVSPGTTPSRAAALEAVNGGWRSAFVADEQPREVRVARDRFARLLLVEGVADSIPRVTLTLPERDSVLRRAEGQFGLAATLHDDLGLSRASFEVTISSGEGERFTVRTQQIAARALAGARNATLRGSLDITALGLSAGDVVHLRAVARDAHPLADREIGASETRSFRIARPSEYDSIAVEPAPPPEVDKSLLSQRMLLLLTERLEARRRRITTELLGVESRKLARDQGRLRQSVGDAVFQRLTGDAGGEHSHSADDGHDHGVEAIGGKLALSGVNSQGMLEEGDDAPVIAINKPLLEAYNAMWDAGRALEQSDPKAAIPFMRIALEAIERARAASRLYLRGRPPTVIIDLAKVRLVGKDTGAPVARTAREMLPNRSAARESRLLAAAALATSDPLAARDSIALLRLESLADAPSFAEALASLVEVLGQASTAGPVDVTEPFLRARRVLGGVERAPATSWSRGLPP